MKQIDLLKKTLLCVFLLSVFGIVNAQTWTQIGSVIEGEAIGDLSGCSVSLNADGTIIAIGAEGNDDGGNSSGHVRIYENISGTWTQIGNDIAGEAIDDNSGYSVSLNSNGTVVAIGAYLNDGNGAKSGHVRVYQYISGTWTQIGNDIDGEAVDDKSGWSVSLNDAGNIVAIGAMYNNSITGHVRIYENQSGNWIQLGTDIDGAAIDDRFGRSVSLSADGNIVAIGANQDNSDTGYARIYQYSSGVWTQIGADIEGETIGDNSGSSVSLSADGTVIATGAVSNNSSTGHVRIYKNLSNVWTQIGGDINGETVGDNSGWSVSLSADGNVVAISAIFNNSNTGHVRIYENQSNVWTQIGNDLDGEAINTFSGWSVSINSNGTIVAIGSPFDIPNGHVKIYKFFSAPTVITTPVSVSSITNNSAQSGGNVTNDGNHPVTARGVCWSTTSSPTINDNSTNNGSGLGTFTSDITGLESGTTYYYRAFATNSVGTAYGAEYSFTTLCTDPVAPTSISVSADNICPGTNINLTRIGGDLNDADIWQWYTGSCGDTFIGEGTAINVTPTVTTTYYVRAEGACTTPGACASVTVTVEDNQAPIFDAYLDIIKCADIGLTTAVVTYTDPVASDNCSSALTINRIAGSASGSEFPVETNVITYEATDTQGNRAEISFNITVQARSFEPTGTDSPEAPFCKGTQDQITLNYTGGTLGEGAFEYWYSDAALSNEIGTGNELIITAPDTSTTYYVQFAGTCNTTSAVPLEIVVNPLPVLDITPDFETELGIESQLEATYDPDYTYSWTPADQLDDAGIHNPFFEAENSTTLTLTVTDENNCINEKDVDINVIYFAKLNIYNAITPNGDGKNDTWYIEGLSNLNYKIEVRNRAGFIVFESTDYNNNWDGTDKKGRKLQGPHFYTIRVNNSFYLDVKTRNRYTGTISVLR